MGKQLWILGLALLPLAAQATRPDRNAYLDTKASTVAKLIAEIRRDPAVADRYMRHFEMSKADLIAYFETLHVARMKVAMSVSMYSVPAGGYIRVHKDVLRKGELVFADPVGQPILKLNCGNPVVNKVSGETELATILGTPGVTRPMEVAAASAPVGGPVAMMETPKTEMDEVEVALAPPPNNTVTNITNVTNNTTNTTNTTVTKGGGNDWLGLVALPLAGIALFTHHSCCCTTQAPPVPEPAPLAVLSLGALPLLRRRRP